MPRSLSYSILAGLVGFAIYAIMHLGATPAKTQADFLRVGVNFFNAVAIISLLFILHRHEKADATAFGTVVRDNISTIAAALFINLVMTLHAVFTDFGIV